MTKNSAIIAQNYFGKLSKNEILESYTLDFNKIHLVFSYASFLKFKACLQNLELPVSDRLLTLSDESRNITINTLQEDLYLLFSKVEVCALKNLIRANEPQRYTFVNFRQIDHRFEMN